MEKLFYLLLDEARRREVTVAVIRQEGYDSFTGIFRTFGNFGSCIERSAAGDTDEEAFSFGEFLSRFKGLFVADREDFVVNFGIEGFRNEVGTDAWILCGPAWPSERSGESFGSIAMILTDGFFSLRYWPTPEIVPPVPIPAKKMSTAPSVSS